MCLNKLFFLFSFCLSMISCHGQRAKIEKCDISNAINIINGLSEVKKQSKYVDSLSQNKKHLSFMIDSLEMNHQQYYQIKTGYNGEFRWETYTIFYVNKKDCNKIMVDEVVSGDIISIEKWRILKKK